MSAQDAPKAPTPGSGATNRYVPRMKLGFGLFFIFFVFYMGVAILNTPAFKDAAAVPFLGMPLGMTLSLAIFPVSWILMFIFIAKWR